MRRQPHRRRILAAGVAAALTLACAGVPAAAAPARLVALGDSLTAGYGLAPGKDFVTVLEAALRKAGWDVRIANAGVSGDTAGDALARLDWSVPDGTVGVILEIGANDALRGIDPAITRKATDAILARLSARKIPVLVAGMKAPRNLGAAYVAAFDAIDPDLAKAHGAMLYPFFLDGVAATARLNQGDGMHPNAAGVRVIVGRMLPTVERFLRQVAPSARRPS